MGSLGADEAGEDMTVGRTNKSEERTILVATGDAPNGYADDFVLSVSIQNDAVLTSTPGAASMPSMPRARFPHLPVGRWGRFRPAMESLRKVSTALPGMFMRPPGIDLLKIPSAQACSASARGPLPASLELAKMAWSDMSR